MCPELSCSCSWDVFAHSFPCLVSPPPWWWTWVTVLPGGAAGSTRLAGHQGVSDLRNPSSMVLRLGCVPWGGPYALNSPSHTNYRGSGAGCCLPFILGLTFWFFSPNAIQSTVIRCPEELCSNLWSRCFFFYLWGWSNFKIQSSSSSINCAFFFLLRQMEGNLLISTRTYQTGFSIRSPPSPTCTKELSILCFHSCISVCLYMCVHWGATLLQPFESINRN